MLTTARRVVLAAFALLVGALAVPVAASAALATPVGDESKYAAIVVDANSGEVLYAKRADSPRYPASITKVMTLYLTFEAMAQGKLSPDEQITVSQHAASQSPTKLGLRAGSTIRVDDAIRAICVQSANDMAVAMAERLGGSESRFAALMTLKAQELGMMNTHYANANGLPDSRQISTARDIALLSRAIIRDYPQYYAYFSTRQFSYRGQTMNNHNHLLTQMAGVDGLKTGYTQASGYNLAASAVRDGHRLIAVVLGGSSNASRDNHVKDLLETGFEVERRRDAGERIQIAQNMFEHEPIAPLNPEPYGQGDEDGGPKIVAVADQGFDGIVGEALPKTNESGVLSFAKPAGYAQVARVESKPVPNPVEPPAARRPEPGRYLVQVGAFKHKEDARSQLAQVSRSFASHFDDAEGIVGARVNGFFRAQFKGFSEDAARAACSALKAKRMPCMVIAP
jgi:D-alanyl-D-alanine carboxypeptidase (penicillin-binding protein 5/6)